MLILPEGSSPPAGFNSGSQKAVYKIWLEHVLAEGEPIDVTRRYEAAFAAHTSPHRPVAIPVAKNLLIDSDSEDEDRTHDESDSVSLDVDAGKRKAKKTSRPMQKASSDTGVVKVPRSSASGASSSASAKKSTSKPETSPKVAPKRGAKKSAQVSNSSDDEEAYLAPSSTKSKSPAKSSSATAKSSSAVSQVRSKRSRVASDDEDDVVQFSSPPKSSKKHAKSTSPHSGFEVYDVDFDLTPNKTKPSSYTRGAQVLASPASAKLAAKFSGSTVPILARPKAPKVQPTILVYLAKAKDAQKEKYRKGMPLHLMSFVSDVTKATHVVICEGEASMDDPVSFSVLYAMAFAKWVLNKDWLEDAFLTHSIPQESVYEVYQLPGCKLLREMHAERDLYCQQKGISPQHADDSIDPEMPKLLFSDLTFNIDRLKTVFDRTVLKQLHDIILTNGGLIGGEESSDIWITKDPYSVVYGVQYGSYGAPPENDMMLRQRYPHWHKRHFTNANTLREMPTYAIPFDFIRDSILNGATANPEHYRNLMQQLVAL